MGAEEKNSGTEPIRRDGRPSANPQSSEQIDRDNDATDAEERLEEGLEESFPASDPPAITNPTRPGRPKSNPAGS